MEIRLPDVEGNQHTVIADISKRPAHVPLVSEAASVTGHSYAAVENFCPIVLKGTGCARLVNSSFPTISNASTPTTLRMALESLLKRYTRNITKSSGERRCLILLETMCALPC